MENSSIVKCLMPRKTTLSALLAAKYLLEQNPSFLLLRVDGGLGMWGSSVCSAYSKTASDSEAKQPGYHCKTVAFILSVVVLILSSWLSEGGNFF
jgi:hypothetical protein